MLKKIDPNSTSHLTNPSHLKVHLTVVAAQDLNLITRVWKRPRAAVVNVTDAKEKMRSRSIKSEESVLGVVRGWMVGLKQAQDSDVQCSCPARNKKSPVSSLTILIEESLTINLFRCVGLRM